MKASELIGRHVYDHDGKRLGVVTDLRADQRVPSEGGAPAVRIVALIVSRGPAGSLLGYDRRRRQGPWLIRAIVGRLHRDALLIPWEAVASTHDHVRLHPAGSILGSDRPRSLMSGRP